jgi:hypothetical protein
MVSLYCLSEVMPVAWVGVLICVCTSVYIFRFFCNLKNFQSNLIRTCTTSAPPPSITSMPGLALPISQIDPCNRTYICSNFSKHSVRNLIWDAKEGRRARSFGRLLPPLLLPHLSPFPFSDWSLVVNLLSVPCQPCTNPAVSQAAAASPASQPARQPGGPYARGTTAATTKLKGGGGGTRRRRSRGQRQTANLPGAAAH